MEEKEDEREDVEDDQKEGWTMLKEKGDEGWWRMKDVEGER